MLFYSKRNNSKDNNLIMNNKQGGKYLQQIYFKILIIKFWENIKNLLPLTALNN